MRRVITASLNGNAFQIEDDAYAVLAAYLENGARALAGNPDRDEIIADVEQAIADKCVRYLNAHKTVLVRGEIDQIVTEMGPVDGGDAGAAPAGAAGATAGPEPAPAAAESIHASRRLYQISDGALVSGLCNGLAAYLHVDVTIVRVIFVALVFLTGGMVLFAYLVLMFIVPYAQTSEQHAAARGIPFNARTLVERAKQKASEFTSNGDWQRSRDEWRDEWRRTRAEWRDEWRRTRAEWRAQRKQRPPPFTAPAAPTPSPVPYAAHVLGRVVLAILGVFLAVWSIAWAIALVSLVTTGAIFGWLVPHDVPFWLALVGLVIVYELIAWPIKALRYSSFHPGIGDHAHRFTGPDGIILLAVLAALLWYGYHHVPALHDLLDHITWFWESKLDV